MDGRSRRLPEHTFRKGRGRALIQVKADGALLGQPLRCRVAAEVRVIKVGKRAPSPCGRPDACPVESACGRDGGVPCLEIGRAHQQKLALCDSLEALADALPSRLDRLTCLRIASELVPMLRDSHRYEEETVFSAFVQGSADAVAGAASVRRLTIEHIEDECAAQDITDILLALGHGGPVDNPEALGFMLRALFEALRRHIAFELEHLFPVKAGALRARPARQSNEGSSQ